MALLEILEVLLILVLCLLPMYYYLGSRQLKRKSSLPKNWPILGMLPSLLANASRIHDFLTDILKEAGGTLEIKGPWFSNMDIFLSSDPANVQYVLSKNFSNYPKGPEFRKIFDVLGEGILNIEGEVWEKLRRTTMLLINQRSFQQFVATTTWSKAVEGLTPVLDHVSRLGVEVDLQDLCQRFSFDAACISVLGHDPSSLCVDLPHFPLESAINEAEQAILLRHLLPETCWKLQRWLQIGHEKKLSTAIDILDQFVAQCISLKRRDQNPQGKTDPVSNFDLLTGYMNAHPEEKSGGLKMSDKALKDNLINLLLAGRDTVAATLTWFFWLVATNPEKEKKILEEIKANLQVKEDLEFPRIEGLKKLVFLHGALCESLRLFPPVALQHKAPVKPDTLPSGHLLKANTKTVLSFYSMGRMENIWGEDCLEFKPERWISEEGGIKHEPSFKFTAFNTGPRSCLGKEMSFIQMKLVAAATLYHFQFQLVEGHPVTTSNSVILDMKKGLKVRVSRRSSVV